jgi:LDH2 family malate/lactate/ureidoglycolate dehydrogenase
MGLIRLKRCGRFTETASGSQKAPGRERIYTAGEKEYLAWLERKERGVPVNDGVLKELIAVRDELGLDEHRYKFC